MPNDDYLPEDGSNIKFQKIMEERKVTQLIPSKTDGDFAADLKERIIEAYQPLFKVMEEADKKGFGINVQAGKTAMGKFDFAQLQIIKIY